MVLTPMSTNIILDAFSPSHAFFNGSWNSILNPLLSFLQDTDSYLMLNVYPYYVFVQANGVFPLDYALFRPLPPNKEAVDPDTMLHYTNVFDAMVDAAYFAVAALNFSVPVVVSETGWPSAGDANEPDATVDNAITYNSNVVTHVVNNSGTPKHPGVPVNTYIYELFDEDLRPGPTSERNWGLFSSNSTPLYVLHLAGGSILANDTTSQEFCVANSGADSQMLQAALDWACGPGAADCQAIQPGGSCYEPNTVKDHASYAFNSYYQKTGMSSGACSFNGVAMITFTDPSHDACNFPGSIGSTNGTFTNGTGLSNVTFPLIGSNGTNSTFNSSAHHLQTQFHPIFYPVLALPFLLWNLPIF